ncbi:MAG: deoxyguanosinetriphosphate triphosphohydrolase, partial [Lachnospiraceae bacterium]|nr:deoxyguanosinetriphosphate triphosphohydrolase [Lachnospiraceae bacterium]
LTEKDIPKEIGEVLGYTTGERLDRFIHDIVTASTDKNDILMSPEVAEGMQKLRQFMFERVYQNPDAKSEESKAEMLVTTLYEYYLKHLELLPEELLLMHENGTAKEIIVCDYIAAMTDRFAIAQYDEIFIPKSWHG